MEHLDKDLPFHSAQIVIQEPAIWTGEYEVSINGRIFDVDFSPKENGRLVEYFRRTGNLTSAKIDFVGHKFYTYTGPAKLRDLFINIAEQWLASDTST